LAEAELTWVDDHVSKAIYFTVDLCDGSKRKLLVWTTTPYTLPANQAIAIRSDLIYTEIRMDGQILVVLQDRLGYLIQEGIIPTDATSQVTFEGSELLKRGYEKPYGGSGLIINAEFVTADAGTGIVHIAPGHGQDDYSLGLKHGIGALCVGM